MKKLTHKIITLVMAIAITATSVNPLRAGAATKKKAAINKKSVTLTITNKKKAPAVTLKVKNANVKKVKWTTSNKKVATIKVTGKYSVKITAKKAGKANITCKVKGKKLVCKVIVKDKRKTNSNKNNSDKTVTPKCSHEWAEKWTVYEHEGDYDNNASACYCGVFASEKAWDEHLFFYMPVWRTPGLYSKKERETGIHGDKAKGAPSIHYRRRCPTHNNQKRIYRILLLYKV